jgi:hypothetical protein
VCRGASARLFVDGQGNLIDEQLVLLHPGQDAELLRYLAQTLPMSPQDMTLPPPTLLQVDRPRDRFRSGSDDFNTSGPLRAQDRFMAEYRSPKNVDQMDRQMETITQDLKKRHTLSNSQSTQDLIDRFHSSPPNSHGQPLHNLDSRSSSTMVSNLPFSPSLTASTISHPTFQPFPVVSQAANAMATSQFPSFSPFPDHGLSLPSLLQPNNYTDSHIQQQRLLHQQQMLMLRQHQFANIFPHNPSFSVPNVAPHHEMVVASPHISSLTKPSVSTSSLSTLPSFVQNTATAIGPSSIATLGSSDERKVVGATASQNLVGETQTIDVAEFRKLQHTV